jgi:chromosome segregation ATPase
MKENKIVRTLRTAVETTETLAPDHVITHYAAGPAAPQQVAHRDDVPQSLRDWQDAQSQHIAKVAEEQAALDEKKRQADEEHEQLESLRATVETLRRQIERAEGRKQWAQQRAQHADEEFDDKIADGDLADAMNAAAEGDFILGRIDECLTRKRTNLAEAEKVLAEFKAKVKAQ